MLKKMIVVCFIAVFMLCAFAHAESVDIYDGDSDLAGIEDYYTKARAAENNGQLTSANTYYEKIINKFEEIPDLMSFQYANQYYYYAMGRLEMSKPDFSPSNAHEALDYFNRCRSKYVEDVDYFKSFLNGLICMERGEYEAAVSYLESASDCDLLQHMGVGDYTETAIKQRDQIAEQAREEEKRKQEEENERLAREAEKEARAKAVLSLNLNAVQDDPYAIRIQWNNPIHTYILVLSPMADTPVLPTEPTKNGPTTLNDAQAGEYIFWYISEYEKDQCSLDVSGLWPGTRYYVWLYDAEQSAASVSKSFITPMPEDSTLLFGNKTYLLWTCSKADYTKGYSAVNSNGEPINSPHGYLLQWNATQKVGDKQTILVSENNLLKNCYYALISFYEMNQEQIAAAKEALFGKTVALYVHVNGYGTAKVSGIWPIQQVLFMSGSSNYSKLTVYLGDLLDQFDDIPAGVTYSIDVVIDDMLVHTFSGVTQ